MNEINKGGEPGIDHGLLRAVLSGKRNKGHKSVLVKDSERDVIGLSVFVAPTLKNRLRVGRLHT